MEPSYIGVSEYTATTSKGTGVGVTDGNASLLVDGVRVTRTCALTVAHTTNRLAQSIFTVATVNGGVRCVE